MGNALRVDGGGMSLSRVRIKKIRKSVLRDAGTGIVLADKTRPSISSTSTRETVGKTMPAIAPSPSSASPGVPSVVTTYRENEEPPCGRRPHERPQFDAVPDAYARQKPSAFLQAISDQS